VSHKYILQLNINLIFQCGGGSGNGRKGVTFQNIKRKRVAMFIATDLRKDTTRFVINRHNSGTCTKFKHLFCCCQNCICWWNCNNPGKFISINFGW